MHIIPRLEELEGPVGFLFSNGYTLAVVAPTLTIIVLLLLFSRKFAFVEALVEVSIDETHIFYIFMKWLMRMMDTMQLFGLRPLAPRSGSVPGALFQWPNGQGTAKFFGGRAAARDWKQQYGSMYSIWSGFEREMLVIHLS
jgi:hypothetical protein